MSYSTPSDWLPAMNRRPASEAALTVDTPITAPTSHHIRDRSPSRIASITSPVRNAIAIAPPCVTIASSTDTARDTRYGRRYPRSRTNVLRFVGCTGSVTRGG